MESVFYSAENLFPLRLIQVVILHHMLSKAAVRARPSVLWCYKKDLGFSRWAWTPLRELDVASIKIRSFNCMIVFDTATARSAWDSCRRRLKQERSTWIRMTPLNSSSLQPTSATVTTTRHTRSWETPTACVSYRWDSLLWGCTLHLTPCSRQMIDRSQKE